MRPTRWPGVHQRQWTGAVRPGGPDAVPAFYAGDVREWLDNAEAGFLPETLAFSWLPLLIALWLGKLGGVVLVRLADPSST